MYFDVVHGIFITIASTVRRKMAFCKFVCRIICSPFFYFFFIFVCANSAFHRKCESIDPLSRNNCHFIIWQIWIISHCSIFFASCLQSYCSQLDVCFVLSVFFSRDSGEMPSTRNILSQQMKMNNFNIEMSWSIEKLICFCVAILRARDRYQYMSNLYEQLSKPLINSKRLSA